jgi:hypothetical protein
MNHLYDGRSVTISDYRKVMGDKISTDKQIEKRIQYLDTFCRNIIKAELGKFLAKNHSSLKSVK